LDSALTQETPHPRETNPGNLVEFWFELAAACNSVSASSAAEALGFVLVIHLMPASGIHGQLSDTEIELFG
jgi:hypothetical protein